MTEHDTTRKLPSMHRPWLRGSRLAEHPPAVQAADRDGEALPLLRPVQGLKEISIKIPEKLVTAFIGPSGCGKSTLLRCFNRMNDLIDSVRIEGLDSSIAGHDITAGRWT